MDAESLDDDRETLLAECLIFRALNVGDRHALAARAKRVSFAAGETIFRLADPGRSMMVVAEGTVRVSLPSDTGYDIALADLGRGAVLGEISLLDGRPRSATAIAVTSCTLLTLDRPAIGPILKSNPATCLAVVDLLCERLRRADERLVEISIARSGSDLG